MNKNLLTSVLLIISFHAFAEPADSSISSKAEKASIIQYYHHQADSMSGEMKFHTGKIKFASQSIKMTVPEDHYFIEAEQARFILENLWGNAADGEVLGMIVRKDFNPSEVNNDYSFVISYAPVGFIPFEEKAPLDHAALLNGMQNQLSESNEQRLNHGLNALQVTNWVMVPYFDNYRKALYWATELTVNGSEEKLLNYNLRLLGKEGVIKINAVATMDQFPMVKQLLPYLLAQTKFDEGFQYNDQQDQTSTASGWKMEELITGKEQENFLKRIPTPLAAGSVLMLGVVIFARRFSIFKRKPVPATA